jgi:hypothetical protein
MLRGAPPVRERCDNMFKPLAEDHSDLTILSLLTALLWHLLYHLRITDNWLDQAQVCHNCRDQKGAVTCARPLTLSGWLLRYVPTVSHRPGSNPVMF